MAEKTIKLGERATVLLQIVERDCRGGKGIFYPPNHLSSWADGEPVGGAGDAKALLSLESRGLIESISLSAYSYKITPEGQAVSDALPWRYEYSGSLSWHRITRDP